MTHCSLVFQWSGLLHTLYKRSPWQTPPLLQGLALFRAPIESTAALGVTQPHKHTPSVLVSRSTAQLQGVCFACVPYTVHNYVRILCAISINHCMYVRMYVCMMCVFTEETLVTAHSLVIRLSQCNGVWIIRIQQWWCVNAALLHPGPIVHVCDWLCD